MSSTSSEQSSRNRSATDVLASRYRQLFVLPSAPLLLLYGVMASLLLAVLSKGPGGIFSFVLALAVFTLTASAISSGLRLVDKKTIATFRRVTALLVGGEILWLVIVAVGAAYAWFSGSAYATTNAFLFGAFVCAGFEFIVINGAFEKSALFSFILAVIHPTATLLVVRLPELTNHFDPVAAAGGATALALLVAFPVQMGRKKTSLGHSALSLFQSFMKTWTSGDSDELEGVIASHSEQAEATTKVLRFRTRKGDTFLVLPGVHPGPFHPVGSYDLPGVVSRAFKDLGPVMTLHMPGGHERNLATRAETLNYAQSVKELAQSLTAQDGQAALRGPIHARVGNATVSTCAFGNDMIMTVSFAPLGSDDLDTHVEDQLSKPASDSGFDLSIVDAHNSIDPNLKSPATGDPGWKQLFEATGRAEPEPFNVAYSHSNEIGFTGNGDLTENGLGLLMIQSNAAKSALILADANNSVSSLRAEVAKALGSAGYDLIEFCTSDSHNLAARGLTAERGYEALGEATSPQSIVDATVKLARLAETRLAPAEYGSAKMKSKVRIFGSKALAEFASITQSSSRFSRNYFRFASVVLIALLLASLFF